MAADTCRVCGQTLAADRAACNQCGSDFHFALRTDSPTKDCGDAWIDDELQALVFACNSCLGKLPPLTGRKRYTLHEGARASDVARMRREGGRTRRPGHS